MKPITVEIHGTGTHNRGAELMAIAIINEIKRRFPESRIVVPIEYGEYADRARRELFTTWESRGLGRGKFTSFALRFGSPGFCRRLGVVSPRSIDAVLDASGFAYSDQWGDGPASELLEKMNRPARRDIPLILLPQALGPFGDPIVADKCAKVMRRATLVCARDKQSLEAVRNLGGSTRIAQYPDFTLGVEGRRPQFADLPPDMVAIVPNYRMLDKTKSAGGYLQFVEASIEIAKRAKLNPVFVLHDANEDRNILKMLSSTQAIPVIELSDPCELKYFLGQAKVVVGSRFHALVSAFSQGVPCIGLGWSHKYEELFEDFHVPDWLIQSVEDIDSISVLMGKASQREQWHAVSGRLAQATEVLKVRNAAMWDEITAIISSRL
jgi:polysaccharide pyruvyl transferase WcaK-like protein